MSPTSGRHRKSLWDALTTPEFQKQYWFGAYATSEWKAGSSWDLRFSDDQIVDAGEIAESAPPRRLAIKWRNEKPELKAEGYSICVFDIEPTGEVTKTVTHGMDYPNAKTIHAVSGGWPKVLSNLKSLLETGHVFVGRY